MYIYSQVGLLFFFFFFTLDCESVTTGHLYILHRGCMPVCLLAHTPAEAAGHLPWVDAGPCPQPCPGRSPPLLGARSWSAGAGAPGAASAGPSRSPPAPQEGKIGGKTLCFAQGGGFWSVRVRVIYFLFFSLSLPPPTPALSPLGLEQMLCM